MTGSDDFADWARRPPRNTEEVKLTDPAPLMGPAVSMPGRVVDMQQALERFEQRLRNAFNPGSLDEDRLIR